MASGNIESGNDNNSANYIKCNYKLIADYTKFAIAQYQQFMKDTGSRQFIFWDIVVLTSADTTQKEAFELQLADKIKKDSLPSRAKYHVFADLPGTKAGNGGATINSLAALRDIYKDNLQNKKILMIHAGGQSRRLPSASILGKIFTLLPCGSPFMQMLDFKLAIFLPFLKRMTSGVFVTCADDIVPYTLDNEADWSFQQPGFTALAHPSSLETGTTHGVYVLKDASTFCASNSTEMFDCLRVLQKPTIPIMHEMGAVVSARDKYGVRNLVYSDSAFFFSHDVSRKFLEFYDKRGYIDCEIDAYGDFLQALGPKGDCSYLENASNVTNIQEHLYKTRKDIFNLLRGTAISVILLKNSKFFHIGTMDEYIENLTKNDEFALVLGVDRKNGRDDEDPNRCILHSSLMPRSTIHNGTVVEFCNFDVAVIVGENSIVSNCEYLSATDENLSIPANTLLHTVPISSHAQGICGYVTIVLQIQTDLKKTVKKSTDNFDVLTYFGYSLKDLARVYHFKHAYYFFPDELDTVSLWYARLHPLQPTMTDSLRIAVKLANLLSLPSTSPSTLLNLLPFDEVSDQSYLSLAQILQFKDVVKMLEYRTVLYDKINRRQ